MTEYIYPNKPTSPNLSGILEAIAASEMTDKNVAGLRWDKEDETLKVFWTDSLDASDKTILDGIVAANS